ncbi:MAG TPA: metalloregulator ArsR/SmtB family transcription factor [Fimbriimonadaceae bacterium]
MEQAVDSRLNKVFAALADSSRRKILTRLAQGPAAIVDLARDLPFTRQAATKHLLTLRKAGLVEDRKQGRAQVYELTPDSLLCAEQWIEGLEADWDRRLGALARHLRENP